MAQESSQLYLQRIFHPSDFSDASNVAFVHALKLALAANSRLTILHTGGAEKVANWAEFPRVRRVLERWELLPPNSPKEAIFTLGLDVEKVASPHSDAVRGILHYLEKHPHDLIVLATHQYDGLDRLRHKSVAEPVARRSGEMALFVPHGMDGFVSLESGAVSLRNILIPVDRAPDPQVAVDGAVMLAHALELHDVTFTTLHVGGEGSEPDLVKPRREGWRWRSVREDGVVEQEILKAARDDRADLIVMTTAGHHGVLDALRGSTTERIVRAAKCPVLAVPAPSQAQVTMQEAMSWQPATG
jgi:nucleotide-binding universal stress UspA family protein